MASLKMTLYSSAIGCGGATRLLTAGQALNVKLEDLPGWMIYGSSQPVDIATYLLRFVNGSPTLYPLRTLRTATGS